MTFFSIGGRGTKHVRFAPLDGSAMTPPGSLPHNAIAPVFSTYIRLRQISELISKLIETLHNSDQQWALSVLLQTTQILSKAPAVKLLCASLGDVVDTEFIQQHFSLVFSELSHHLAPTCTWTSGVVPSLPYRCSWLLASVLRSQVRVVLDPPPVQTYTVNNSAVTPSVVKGLTKAASVPLYELIELKPPLSSSPGNKSKSKKKPATEEEEFALSAPVEELGVSAVLNKAVVIIAEFLSRRALKHSPTATMYNVLSSFKESGSWDEVRLSEWVAAELSSSHIKDMIMTAQISLAAERARKFLWHLLSPSQVREVFLDRSSISVPPSTDNPAILYQLFSEGDTSSVTDVFDLQLSPWSVMQKCAEILFHDGALEEPHYALFSTDYDSFLKMVSRPFLDADVRKECEEIVQNIPLLPTVHAIYSPSNSKSRRKGPGKDDKSAKKLAKTIRNIESLASLDKYVIEDLLLVHSDLIFEFPVVHIQKK